jgi:hypothetical protein
MQRSRIVLLGAIASLATFTGTALAVYNTPAKAKTLKVDMVVAYACTAPNASSCLGGSCALIPACTPPVARTNTNPANVTTFGPKGSANATIGVGKGDLKIGIKAGDVLNNGVPANAVSLGSVSGTVIATSGNCAPGLPPQPAPVPGTECTSTNLGPLFSAVFTVPCTAGKCALKTTVNTIVPGTVTIGGLANTQIDGIGLSDPDGDLAFVTGVFIP